MRLRLGAALALLTLCGCELEPGDPVFLSGRVQEADGSPWRGAPPVLLRPRPDQPYPEEAFAQSTPWRTLAVEADGTFLQRLDARDLGVGDPAFLFSAMRDTLQLELPPGADGARDTMLLRIDRDVDAPPLRRWESGVRLEEGPRLRWSPAPAVEDIPTPAHRVQLHGGGELAWEMDAPGAERLLFAELWEDFPDARASVLARAEGYRRWLGAYLSYTVEHRSPAQPLPAAGRVPESRGAACRTNLSALEPCPLTDGQLTPFRFEPTDRYPEALTLQLRAPLRPVRLLLRDLRSTASQGSVLLVEGSADGTRWQPLGSTPAVLQRDPERVFDYVQLPFLDVALTPPVEPVSHVRVRLLGDPRSAPPGGEPWPGSFYSLREVSVFAAPASP